MHPLILKLTASEGLDVALIKRLMHALNDMAALHANANEVCAFNVVGRVQEFLREHNKKPEDSADKIPQSMWHQASSSSDRCASRDFVTPQPDPK